MSDEKGVTRIKGHGYTDVGVVHGEGPGSLTIGWGPPAGEAGYPYVEVEVSIEPPVKARVVLDIGTPPLRKLRPLRTYARQQGRLGAEMDVDDELRAMRAIATTLQALPPDVRARVLDWLKARNVSEELAALSRGYQPAASSPSDVAESLRIAQERLSR